MQLFKYDRITILAIKVKHPKLKLHYNKEQFVCRKTLVCKWWEESIDVFVGPTHG